MKSIFFFPWDMLSQLNLLALALVIPIASASPPAAQSALALTPFRISLTSAIPRLQALVKNTRLPKSPAFPGERDSLGLDLAVLKQWKDDWVNPSVYSWAKEEAELNKYHHFKAAIEGLDIHFVHERSSVKGAIPLLLIHGWPGSFQEFLPVITPLTQAARTENGTKVSFHVVVASIPGYTFSSPAPSFNWTVADSGRVFNTLMTKVLGYETYSTFGTDWGSVIAYSMYESFPANVRAASFDFIPFFPPSPEQIAAENVTLTADELERYGRFQTWATSGNAYFSLLSTKPTTISTAIYDSPIGQLAWIGEKIVLWSDPAFLKTPDSTKSILTAVSLYYLTETIVSSSVIYAQNQNGFRHTYTKAPNDAPLLFMAFKYNIGYWPKEWVAKTGNLVRYTAIDKGGHFPGLDDPVGFIDELREIGAHWKA